MIKSFRFIGQSLASATVFGFSAMTAFAADPVAVPDPVSGDVFLAFRASSDQGADVSYIVNLGQDTAFRNAAPGTSFTLSGIGNIGQDLVDTFGANWHSRETVFWGAFGVRGTSSPSVIGSRPRQSVSVATAPWPALSQTGRSSVGSAINGVLTGIGGYRTRIATANSAVATLQPNSGGGSSYSFQVAATSTTDFGTLSQWSSIEGSFEDGAAATVLDLHRVFLESGVEVSRHLGKLTIGETGVVTFTAASVAPPSNVDTDGDGQTDAQEAIAGTNPNDGTSFFRVQGVERASGVNNISFQSAPNRTYVIEFSSSLAAGSWQFVSSHSSGASGAAVVIQDNDSARLANPAGFYRVKISQ